MSVSLTDEHLISKFSNILYTDYNKHFEYHSEIENYIRLGTNIKGIALKRILSFS